MTGPPPPPEPPREPPAGPPEARDETPWRNAPRPKGGGSVWLGIVVGVVAFTASVLLAIALSPLLPGAWSGLLFLLPIGYIVISAIVAGRSRTARFGAGLLIAIGVSLLLAAGICTAVVFSGRSIA